MIATDTFDTRVRSITNVAQGIKSFELVPLASEVLPSFAGGAHIDLYLGNGLVRSYSLINSQNERNRYVVAVNRDAASRGGSVFLHDVVRAGDTLKISAPRNNFSLVEDATRNVFFGGGIGITPLWCMIQRLEDIAGAWELYYSARTRENAAFLEELRALENKTPGRVNLNFDQEPGGTMLDLKQLISGKSANAHLYCCGPTSMLAAFESACTGRHQSHVHTEYFSAKTEAATQGGFTVVLARSGKSFRVAYGKSILDTLLDNNIDPPYSCMQGVCGTCETKVINGVPDHRDALMTEAEHASRKTMMICCSGSKSEELVLDL
jgi:ferredoxin-NADP reductase